MTDRDPELDEVRPDSKFLKALAEAHEGRFYAAGEGGPPLANPEAGRWIDEREEHPIWAGAWLPLWVALLLSVSWWIRRKSGGR